MRHDFRTRQVAPLKEVPGDGTECMCGQCQTSRQLKQQYFNRMSTYGGGVQMDMTINHHRQLNNADSDPRIGQYVSSKTGNTPLYHKPGEAPYFTAKAKTLGKVVGFNAKGNWMYVKMAEHDQPDAVFFGNPDNFVFTAPSATPVELTASQKLDAAMSVGSVVSPSGAIIQPVVKTGEKAVTAIGDSLTGLLGPLKWVAIALVIVILVAIFLRIKG